MFKPALISVSGERCPFTDGSCSSPKLPKFCRALRVMMMKQFRESTTQFIVVENSAKSRDMSPILTLQVLAGWIYDCTDGSERKCFMIFKLTSLHTWPPVEFLYLPPPHASWVLFPGAATTTLPRPGPSTGLALAVGSWVPGACPVTGTAGRKAAQSLLPLILSIGPGGGDFVPENRGKALWPPAPTRAVSFLRAGSRENALPGPLREPHTALLIQGLIIFSEEDLSLGVSNKERDFL